MTASILYGICMLAMVLYIGWVPLITLTIPLLAIWIGLVFIFARRHGVAEKNSSRS